MFGILKKNIIMFATVEIFKNLPLFQKKNYLTYKNY